MISTLVFVLLACTFSLCACEDDLLTGPRVIKVGTAEVNAGRLKSSVAGGAIYSKGAAGGLVGVNALTGTVMNSLSFADLEFELNAGFAGIFLGKNDGMMLGCAYDAANCCKQNGANVGRTPVEGVTEMSEAEILARDFILYELPLADSAWNIREGEIPTLHFEALYPDIPD